jgi:hypothetical protein
VAGVRAADVLASRGTRSRKSPTCWPPRCCACGREIGKTGLLPKGLQRDADRLLPGTVLTRVFDGVEHRVRVVGLRDFEYQGRRFKSLSAVARAIAGCPWSGPVFFGLKPGHKTKMAA